MHTVKFQFTKMQAYGNDYVYVDAVHQKIEQPEKLAILISDRHFGVGADGLVLICPSEKCDFRMRIFDPDGTEAEMCGNALRSTAKFVYYHKMTDKTDLFIETLGGIKHAELIVENGEVVNIHAKIGKPEFAVSKIPVITEKETFINEKVQVLGKEFYASSLSWGNPHTVIFVDDVLNFDVQTYGPAFENLFTHFPKRTNVTFAQIVDKNHIKIREWERGTGETIGCGTGCCSAVVFANLLGMGARSVDVEQIGGTLHVDWDDEDIVHMTGPSHVVYQGEYTYEA